MSRRREYAMLAWALLIAAGVLLVCSKSSPLYPINDWADANIYLTIGKGMTQGQVLYRDLYDHKGPLLYALHALCAWISFSDFTGVWLMEVALGTAFLVCVQKVLALFGVRKASWTLTALLALLIFTSVSFAQGDSAEEMCLPLATATLYGVLSFFQSRDERMKTESLVLHGCLAGCVFWIKFTMIGLHAGLLLAVLLRHAVRREWKQLCTSLGWLAAGFGLSTLPWVMYFGINGAIGDWLKTYLYDNLFLYSSAGEAVSLGGRIKNMIKSALDWFRQNLQYTFPMALGLLWVLRSRCLNAWQKAALWLMAAVGAAGTFIGGKSYLYYGLALAPAVIAALIPLGCWLESRMPAPKAVSAVCAALVIGLCPVLSPNAFPTEGYAIGSPREDTMQYRFARLIEPGASVLNYGFMDAGFFTAAGLVPRVKYFHQTNVPLEEMLSEQIRYLEEGLCDYVITRGKQPESISVHYEWIATEKSPSFWYENVHLYRLKTLRNR